MEIPLHCLSICKLYLTAPSELISRIPDQLSTLHCSPPSSNTASLWSDRPYTFAMLEIRPAFVAGPGPPSPSSILALEAICCATPSMPAPIVPRFIGTKTTFAPDVRAMFCSASS